MSRSNYQDDLFVPWDDLSATQLENNDEKKVDTQSSFLLNSSKATLDDFLNELLDLPTKNTPILRAPLGDISNKRQQKHSTFPVKEKEQKKQSIPTLTRMDSVDDSIWADFDPDLLSLIDAESKKSNGPDKNKITNSIPSKNLTPVHEKSSIDDTILSKLHNDKVSYQSSKLINDKTTPKEDHISIPKVIKQTITSENQLSSIPIDESLFLPQVTEDGHIIKELPTPTGPAAGFQSAKLIGSIHTNKPTSKEDLISLNRTSIPEVPELMANSIKPFSTNIPKEPFTASFMTASGKKLKEPSAKGIQKALSLFEEPDAPKNFDAVIHQFGGFKTGGSKKSFDIPSQAKRNAMSAFNESEFEIADKKIHVIDNVGSSELLNGKSDDISKVEIERTSTKRHRQEDDDDMTHKRQKDSGSFEMDDRSKLLLEETFEGIPKASFTTASGKKLKEPSSEGIQRATALFEGSSQKSGKYDAVINQYGGFKMGNSKKSFDISSQAKRKAISVLNEVDEEVESKNTRSTTPLNTDKPMTASKDKSDSFDNDTNNLQAPKKNSTKDEAATDSGISSNDSMRSNNSTATNSSSPTIKPNAGVPSKPSTSLFPKRNSNTLSTMQRQNKPFKSPIIKSNIELTKAAVNNGSSLKMKLAPVFNLEVPDFRFKLSSLGAPGNFTKSQLIANNIPISIINMTISTAKRYVFDGNWGPKEARNDMIKSGVLPRRVTIEWVENHYVLIVWKIACLIRSYNQFMDRWKPQAILEQLLYRYEREMNMGNRPVLRRILEKDDLPVKHMVLMITDIIEIKSSIQYNTSSKYRLQLSDGWYQVPACVDLRIEKAITKKKLKVGSKLSICGASVIGDKDGIHPLENTDNSTMLSITANSSLPSRWHTKLGYHPRKFITRTLPSIFYDGGIVTSIDIIVCRKFPIMYSETLPNGSLVTRNAKEEEEARRIALGYDSYGVCQKTPGNKNDTPAERRVSGYFKIRICDHIASVNQQWATLLLSNANELNHMDISEGNRYKIFFVVPYHPKNKKYPGLDMKTTRVTRWEPAPTLNLLNSYMARSLTKCDSIQYKDHTSDFDLAVLVLQTGPSTLEVFNGRRLWKQTLLVSDETQSICQVNFRLPMNPFPDIKGQVIGLLNLRYEMYDAKFDITCLKANDESESVSKISAAAEYVQKGILSLKRWANDNPDKIQRLHDRIENMQ